MTKDRNGTTNKAWALDKKVKDETVVEHGIFREYLLLSLLYCCL